MHLVEQKTVSKSDKSSTTSNKIPLSSKMNRVAAPDRTFPSNQLQRLENVKQVQPTFNLFENFTFSLSNAHENQGIADNSKLQTVKNNWEDDVLSRFSHMNLQTEETRQDHSKAIAPREGFLPPSVPDIIQQRKCFGPFNQNYQQVVFSEKGPCHQLMGPPNVQYVYTQIPNFLFPTHAPFLEPWPMRNVGPQFYIPPNHQNLNYWEELPSNVQRVEFPNYNCHQNRFVEPQILAGCEECQDSERRSEQGDIQHAGLLRRNKTKVSFPKPKPLRKIGSKFSQNRKYNYNREQVEIQDFVATSPEPIPKGARPILSSRK